jgi:hypothetical protein
VVGGEPFHLDSVLDYRSAVGEPKLPVYATDGLNAVIVTGTQSAVEFDFGLARVAAVLECRVVEKPQIDRFLELQHSVLPKQHDGYVCPDDLDRKLVLSPVRASSQRLDHSQPPMDLCLALIVAHIHGVLCTV